MQTAEVVEFPMVRDSKYLGVIIEPSRDDNLSEQALKLLKDYYCIEGEDSPHRKLCKSISCILIWRYGTRTKNLRLRFKGVVHVCITCIIKRTFAWQR